MEGCIKILSPHNQEWNESIERLPREKQDIYFLNYYFLFWDEKIYGQAEMFVYEEGAKIGLYSYMKHPIWENGLQGEYYDIETVYGYGGPLVNSDDEEFRTRFEEAFLEYCAKEKIVAEFIRFHPLIRNESVFRSNIQVLHNRKTVVLNLEQELDEIWMQQISTQNRSTIRKCMKNNLRVEESSQYEAFMSIYNDTMKKVGADDFYLFDEEYFKKLQADEHCTLLCVKEGECVLAAAVFMGYGDYFHYHLSGSRKEALKLSPNNILLWEAIQYGKAHGYKKMHFGGGLTDSTEDNLFRFKSKFSREYADFYIGKRIHNEDIYRDLIINWEKIHGIKATRLLQYREK